MSGLLEIRRRKLEACVAAGKNPFACLCEQRHTSREVVEAFESDTREPKETTVQVAGRIVLFRLMGKASFIKILDRDGTLQVYVSQDGVGIETYAEFKKYDVGDIVGVEGSVFRTQTGEVTVRAQKIELVAKSLRPLPEKWHGLNDSDTIYRQRYLDLIVNKDSRRRFFLRSRILQEIRTFLWRNRFVEVETPVLQDVPGGAAARPFLTHMNALDKDFYLRISLELYLKRMLIAGYDRVFEMGRVFRNEGLSRRHNPEFTMLEVYQAYSDYRGMMKLVYDLIQHLCRTVLQTTEIRRPDGTVLCLDGAWREVTYKDLLREATGDERWVSRSKEEKRKACEGWGLEVDPRAEDFEITKNVFEKRIEPTLLQPTFVTHLPRELCPLAKLNSKDPTVLDVFELCINGQEIAPAYSEQNDPVVQREMFERQVGEEVQKLDRDFLTAMEYGMPPAGGMGIGIDRLVGLLTGADNIRETLLYPTVR
ncbi:MAG: lysine--tRNA ligase [Puniceicoccales bacterium]|nr:lysine--tRNA ligase [Puniceicoccales bacterium]